MRYFVSIAGITVEVDLSGSTPAVDGEPVTAELGNLPGTPIRSMLLDGTVHTLLAEPADRRGGWELTLRGRRYTADVVDERTRAIREMTGGEVLAIDRSVRAPMPGLVTRVEVSVGQVVRAGEGLVIVEAMKMENELRAPADGVVARIEVVPGQTVEKGAVLVVLE
jgi:acetyl/propionyl-CoA carboxylase alpha subunit